MGTLQLWEVTVMQDLHLKIKQCDHCVHTHNSYTVFKGYIDQLDVVCCECYGVTFKKTLLVNAKCQELHF